LLGIFNDKAGQGSHPKIYSKRGFWRYPVRSTLAIIGLSFLSGCSNLSSFLFFPHQGHYQTPDKLGLEYQTIELKSEHETLVNWYIEPKTSAPDKGCILFLHGNGENISTHINSVAWLSLEGYKLFLLDYRGYGYSSGDSTLRSAMYDIYAAHNWLSQQDCGALFLLGQSMGGALAITYAANYQTQIMGSKAAAVESPSPLVPFSAITTESAPANWPQIAREAMRNHWLTWALQLPASLIESDYNPEKHIKNLKGLPILLMHSKHDKVVGHDHFKQLENEAKKAGITVNTYQTLGGHIYGFAYPQARQFYLNFLNRHSPIEPKPSALSQ